MKITNIFLLVTDITLDGGVERVVCNMANSFAERNYNVVIISMFSANQSLNYQFRKNIKIEIIKGGIGRVTWMNKHTSRINLIRRYQTSVHFTRLIYAIIDQYSKGGKSVLLTNSYLYATPLYRHRNVHIIGLDHSRYPFGNMTGGIRHWLHTYMIRKFDVVTTLNEDELDKWKSIGPPVYIMPNFLPQNWINNNASTSKRNKVIVSMGRMNTNQKGFDRLIEAYSLIAAKHPVWKLNIYGSGCLQKEYRQLINDLNMQDFIEIFDFTKKPLAVYQTASIYAMCSRDEGFGMVLLEAGSLGVPLVAYNVEFGPRSIIKNSVTGYIVPDGDKVKFAESLEKLMNDDNLREKMSENIRKDIPARFSEEVIMDKWIKIINSI